MTKFNNGKITSTSVLYNRGVPSTEKNFALLASINYAMLRQVARYYKKNGRQDYSLF
jgi:hypothetical protein